MNMRTRFSLLITVLGINFLFVIAPPVVVQGATYNLSPGGSGCEYLGGSWVGIDCTIPSGTTVTFWDHTLNIPLGYRLKNHGFFNNFGTINNAGIFNNTGTFLSYEYFNNAGTIENYGWISIGEFNNYNDGTIFNYATFEIHDYLYNDGTIFNFGIIDTAFYIYNFGTIVNAGTIRNWGGGGFHNYIDGTIDNWGTIDFPYGFINNGNINNYCSGEILGPIIGITDIGPIPEVCDGIDNDCNGLIDEGTTDTDGDGICDGVDTCPNDPENDVDRDGLCSDVDNCPEVYNPEQADSDDDGIGDVCDDDTPPALSPPTFTYEEGTTGHVLRWTMGDLNPGFYEIYEGSDLVQEGSWIDGETIEYNIDGLAVGPHEFTLVICDDPEYGPDNCISDTVYVTVYPSDGPTPAPLFTDVLRMLPLAVLAGALVVIRRKRKRPSAT